MFTNSAGPKALMTVIRALLEGDEVGIEAAMKLLEVNGLWRGGSGGLSKLALRDSLKVVIDDYETTSLPQFPRSKRTEAQIPVE